TASESFPQQAARVANAFAAALVKTRAQQAQRSINRAIARLTHRRSALPPTASAEATALSTQIARLETLSIAEPANADVASPAAVPATPASPRPVHDAALALGCAFALVIVLVLIIDMLDQRLRTPGEVAELTGKPVLGTAPTRIFRSGTRTTPVELAAAF